MDTTAGSEGEPDLVWRSPTVDVRTCSVSSMDNNVYLVTCTSTGAQALVDAADEARRIEALVPGGSASIGAVITTHRHWDHHRALSEVVAASNATTYAGRDDADHLPVATEVCLDHGDAVSVGDLELGVVGLRGHTPGSVALALPGGDDAGTTLLFTGDSLFPGGPGRTESPQAFTSLMEDLEQRVFAVFDDTTLVLPGHGAGTTIGEERPDLGQWRQRGW